MVSPGRLEINGGVLSLALVLHLVGAASVLVAIRRRPAATNLGPCRPMPRAAAE